jgi:predicted DNA-binding transcriptional regulator AlpA
VSSDHLQLHPPDPDGADVPPAAGHAAPGTGGPAAPALPPLLLPARQAAALCGVSEATWWRLHSAGRVPAPVRLGGRTLWRRSDVLAFVEMGCPDRKSFEAQQRVEKGR